MDAEIIWTVLARALGPEGPASRLSKVWLFVLAITIHNFPEGLAVGVSFGGGDVAAGLVIATAIGLQKMPEGLAVALPLVREGYSRRKSLLYWTMTGLVEPLGGCSALPWFPFFSQFCRGGLPSLLAQCSSW
jgi:zinc transporter ZupT